VLYKCRQSRWGWGLRLRAVLSTRARVFSAGAASVSHAKLKLGMQAAFVDLKSPTHFPLS
jgi:hypothetical protein